ncbi:hypothetical protein A9W98_25455 [Mycobacterium gordonae]|uniref:DUF4328 domain-containing protein n=1 Tax=Mycobacterium gordonae TaxID=1778 RepID=A0A1A6BD81_MYCGO|nr:DUF4328 domain-containing protein [Mycobacterium gordonae]MBI2699963.1 DUF4328 domain-containing protein [Mycobacterium sp.]MBX9979186.1 DUF4328 domain-containing protein [Mycobacterium gordonae]MCQ4363829.1 DUF4328 domain-containing protein [Mycobacterium gordonae]OBS00332.1 hypothetical protein A9W98_25455 [Mycobacterium gordonae]
MIQVCSQCGTRWNVRERQRSWCPRCRGALMAPLADTPPGDPRWSAQAGPQLPVAPAAPRTPPRLPPGFRWIAVRPGAAPPIRRVRRPLGPTPRYAVIPRWGLVDRVGPAVPTVSDAPVKAGPSPQFVRAVMFATQLVLVGAALMYAVRYGLLIYNRNSLLNSLVAVAADWLGIAASVAAMAATLGSFVVLVTWLIARRAAAFSYHGLPEHRSTRRLWAGCLLPFANLVMAPVYVIELALVEDHYERVRKPIYLWWLAWVVSYAVSLFAIATSLSSDAQGIANNTVLVVFAYVAAAVTVAGVARVFEGFERKPVERPAHRWLVVERDGPTPPVPAAPVELEGQEPAA